MVGHKKKVSPPTSAILLPDWWICMHHGWLHPLGSNVIWDCLFDTHFDYWWTFLVIISSVCTSDFDTQKSGKFKSDCFKSLENLSSEVWDKVRPKLACSATESSYGLEIS